jgi:hypothetical protein
VAFEGRLTRSIYEVLATKPDGSAASPLKPGELGPYLQKHYGADHERRERHRLRDELYRDGGCQYMRTVIVEQFDDPEVQRLRMKWVPHARFSNILKQIIGETSSVYSEPAGRKVGGSDKNRDQYAAHMEALQIDEVMDYANRMLNLHRAVLLGPRVRRDLDGNGTLVLDVVTPANVVAVVHPNDNTLVIAWLVQMDFRSHRTDLIREPKWQLWSDHEVGYLDKDFVPVGDFTEHKLGINPWVALTFHAEAIAGFWPGEDGADLVAAQVSIWMAGILMLKETKSATKQEIATGNFGEAARGTPADTDVTREYPEGASVTVVDRSMPPAQFTDPSDHVLERVAGAYGLAMGALRHDMQSADAREAMMEPLRKIRRQQIKTFRRAERVLARVIARVLEVDASDVAFTVEAFSIDFGEPQVLMSPGDRLDLFLKMRAAGLYSTVEYIRLLNPDIRDDAEAWVLIAKFIDDETKRNELMRPLQAVSGSMGAEVPDPGTANDNASSDKDEADGAAPAPVDEEAA